MPEANSSKPERRTHYHLLPDDGEQHSELQSQAVQTVEMIMGTVPTVDNGLNVRVGEPTDGSVPIRVQLYGELVKIYDVPWEGGANGNGSITADQVRQDLAPAVERLTPVMRNALRTASYIRGWVSQTASFLDVQVGEPESASGGSNRVLPVSVHKDGERIAFYEVICEPGGNGKDVGLTEVNGVRLSTDLMPHIRSGA